MKTNFFIIIALTTFIVSCGDKAQFQKYQSLKMENAELISLCNEVDKQQQHIVNTNTLNINKISEALDVQLNVKKLKLTLETQDLNYSILMKANTRFGYLLKGKKSIKRMYESEIRKTNSEIIRLTGGLSATDYINKHLPE